ncbi:MAG: S-layer homology domain-containing protein [Oscillospiraceae bacterium]|jgi:hypothetical protein|nr:S-layer homology domain-containing protein [Oscillospiraceae bacterium]
MRSLKKILALVLVIVLSMSFVPADLLTIASAASPFSDIAGHWAKDAIEELAGKGVINGMGDGTYNPNGTVTREQFMKLVVAVRGVSDGAKTETFYDVPGNSWANPFVAEGLSRGLVSLSETDGHYFAPASPMDRDTAALWMIRAVGLVGTDESTSFADNSGIQNKSAVAAAVAEGLVKGYEDNTFRPKNTLTRAESAVLIQRLIAKDEELNAPVTEYNDIVLQDGVLKFEPADGVNKMVSGDAETGRYVFENINDDIRNLQKDQIFTIYPCPSVPEGIALKVADIKIDGDTAEIWNAGVELGDVVEKLVSSGSTPITASNVEIASLPEGITVMSDAGELYEEMKAEAKNSSLSANVVNLANPATDAGRKIENLVGPETDVGRKIENLADSEKGLGSGFGFRVDDLKITDTFYISGGIWIEASAVHEIDYNFLRDLITPKKIELYIQQKITFDFRASLKKESNFGKGDAFHDDGGNRGYIFGDTTSYDWAKSISSNSTKRQKENYETKLATISVPIGATGLCAYGSIFFGISVEGEIYFEMKYEQSQKYGFRYQYGKTASLNETEKELNASVGLEGKLEVGLKVEAGVTFLHVINVNLNFKGGVGLKGALEIDSYDHDSADSSTSRTTFGAEKKEDNAGNITEFHDCVVCVDGDIYVYLELGAQIGITNLPKWLVQAGKIIILEIKWTILDENNGKFLDFYISVRPELDLSVSDDSPQVQIGPIEIGLTECPHIYKAPNITKQPENKTVSAGKDVEFSITARNESNKNLQTNNTSAGLSYDWYKDGVSIESGAGDNKLTMGAVAETDAGQYYCVVYLTDYPQLQVKSNMVTLTVNPADPPQIDAEFESPSGDEQSNENGGGDFEIIVPDI